MASTKDMVVTLALSRSGRLVVSERKERGLEGEGQGVRVSARCALSCPRPLWERAAPVVDKECWGEGFASASQLSTELAEQDPSSVANFVRATFSHKGRRFAERAATPRPSSRRRPPRWSARS